MLCQSAEHFSYNKIEKIVLWLSVIKTLEAAHRQRYEEKDLCEKAGISPASVTKIGRNGHVASENMYCAGLPSREYHGERTGLRVAIN